MIHKIKTCQYCGINFNTIEGKVFSNHVRWCASNTTNGDKGRKNISDSKKSTRKTFVKNCTICKNKFITTKLNKKCCSRTCSAKLSQLFVDAKNIAKSMKEKWKDPNYSAKVLHNQPIS